MNQLLHIQYNNVINNKIIDYDRSMELKATRVNVDIVAEMKAGGSADTNGQIQVGDKISTIKEVDISQPASKKKVFDIFTKSGKVVSSSFEEEDVKFLVHIKLFTRVIVHKFSEMQAEGSADANGQI